MFNNRFIQKKGGNFMPPSELRKKAREALKGKWKKATCIILAFFAISMLMGFVQGLINE